MAKNDISGHLSKLTDQELESLKQSLLKMSQQPEGQSAQTAPVNRMGKFLGGTGKILTAGAEGMLLGSQGRSLKEGVFTNPQEQQPDKYEELLRTEQMKNEIDPTRIDARQRQDVRNRKLQEQNNGEEMQDVSRGTSQNKTPPMKIKIGQDEYGVNIFGDNPERKAYDKQQEEIMKGPGAESGRVTLAKESLTNIDDAIKELFPNGDSSSFDRETAYGSNPPAVKLPFVGRVGAAVRRDNPIDPTDNVKAQKAQSVFRKLGAALSGRQLIQTGVAARPEETQKLIEQFAPNFFSNPDSAIKGLQELKAFYEEYLRNSDPETRFSGNGNFSGKVGGKQGVTSSGLKYTIEP